MTERRYKFTTPKLTTHGGTKWPADEWRETSGDGDLCGPGWLHCYASPEVAELMNPIHGAFPMNAQLWMVEVEGESKNDYGLKEGWTRIRRLDERVERVRLTTEQRVEIAIRCATRVYDEPAWTRWANAWLDGSDRSEAAAEAAAAEAAAEAAEAGAAATWAAKAAARAARAERAAQVAAATWVAQVAAATWAAESAATWAAQVAARAAEAALDIDLRAIVREVLVR